MKLKISTKLITIFTAILFLIILYTFYSIRVTEKSLLETLGRNTVFLAEEILKKIYSSLHYRIEELQNHAGHPLISELLTESNLEFKNVRNVSKFIKSIDKNWSSIQRESRTGNIINKKISDMLRKNFIEFYEYKYGYKLYNKIFIVNKFGALIAKTGITDSYRQDNKEWWDITKKKKVYISNIKYDKSDNTYDIFISTRINNKEGNFIGMLAGCLTARSIIRETIVTTDKYETTKISLITRGGKLFFKTGIYKFFKDISCKKFFKKLIAKKGFFIIEKYGRKKFYSYATVSDYKELADLGWIIVVNHDLDEILKPIYSLRLKIILSSLILISTAIFSAFYISRSISRPISKLIQSTGIIGSGELDHRVDIKSDDEIGELARAFNTMTEKRKKAVDELKESERKSRILLENIPEYVFYKDINSFYIYCNDNFAKAVKVNKEDIAGKTDYDFFPDKLAQKSRDDDKKIIETKKTMSFEVKTIVGDKRELFFYTIKTPIRDEDNNIIGILGISHDITDRKTYQEMIKKSLTEKEILLKEIHHRVKNNMQIISSLVDLQLSEIEDKEAQSKLDETKNRIKTMAIIHEKLYKSNDFVNIDMSSYVKDLADKLLTSYNVNNNISINLKMENIYLDIGSAIPCGLIINELVTNSLKYAFPDQEKGKIDIELKYDDRNRTLIIISDNGCGLPEGLDIENAKTMGLKIVNSLIRQLDASLKIERSKGTSFTIIFDAGQALV